jgi:hypothetical protein
MVLNALREHELVQILSFAVEQTPPMRLEVGVEPLVEVLQGEILADELLETVGVEGGNGVFEDRVVSELEGFFGLIDAFGYLLLRRLGFRILQGLAVELFVINEFLGQAEELVADVGGVEARDLREAAHGGVNAGFVALCKTLVEAVPETEGEDLHIAVLADAVDAADALDNAERIPRGVVVDDDVAELEVDAFAAGFGGDEETAVRVLAESADGLPSLRRTMDLGWKLMLAPLWLRAVEPGLRWLPQAT